MPYPAPVGTQWLSTISVEYARELGGLAGISEAYIWPEAHRPLDAWYKRLRGARETLRTRNRTAYTALKLLYTHAIGCLDGHWLREKCEPEALYRPDWRHGVIARARTNLYRNAAKAYESSGQIPFAAAADCWYYVSDEADPIAANPGLRLGDGLGQYKVKNAAIPLTDVLDVLSDATPGARNHSVLRELQMLLNAMSAPEEAGEEVDTLADAEEQEAGQHE
jgi:hypothetical protein